MLAETAPMRPASADARKTSRSSRHLRGVLLSWTISASRERMASGMLARLTPFGDVPESSRDPSRHERVGADPVAGPAPVCLYGKQRVGGLRLAVRGKRLVGDEREREVVEQDRVEDSLSFAYVRTRLRQ